MKLVFMFLIVAMVVAVISCEKGGPDGKGEGSPDKGGPERHEPKGKGDKPGHKEEKREDHKPKGRGPDEKKAKNEDKKGPDSWF